MVGRRRATAAAAALLLGAWPAPVRAVPLEVRVAALVEAGPPAWPSIPAGARIDRESLSFRRREFLKPAPGLPVGDPAVGRALAAALAPLSREARHETRRVLAALGDWAARNLVEEGGGVTGPAQWRDAGSVLRAGTGNGFELVRALTVLCRAAGIPARPSCNGGPVTVVYASPPRGPGVWTVWDPLHPGGPATTLPILWLPLRAGEIPPVAVRPPPPGGCRLILEHRRWLDEASARAVFTTLSITGAFPPGLVMPPAAGTPSRWEVWAIGAAFDAAPPPGTALRIPLPYVKELGIGTRAHAVWVSDPARRVAVTPPQSETDQELGGILMTVAVRL